MHDDLIWQDGQTATGHAVSSFGIAGIDFDTTKIDLTFQPEGHPPCTWPLADVFVQDIPPDTLIVSCKGKPGRLVATGAGAATLRGMLAQSSPWQNVRGRRRRRIAGGIAVMLAGVVGIWLAWPTVSDRLVDILPTRIDAAIGNAVRPLLPADGRQCSSPAGNAALKRIMARLQPHIQSPVPLQVQVIDNPLVNAIAIPGGTIVVYRGLLDNAQSPDEIAGVLAHEVGHQTYRHGMRGLMRHAGAAVVISLLDPSGGLLGNVASHLTQTAHARSFEIQADDYAVRTLNAAGISTRGLTDFFARIHKEHGDTTGLWRYALTHPPLADRIASIPQTDGEPVLNDNEWTALRRICRRAR